MHILTKVFVVLAAVLSVALSALTMTYAFNAESIRREFEDARRDAEAAELALANQSSLHAAEVASLRSDLEAQEREVISLRNQIDSLTARNGQLLREKRKAEADAQAAQGQVGRFEVAVNTQAEVIAALQSTNEDLRASELRFREQRLELEDSLANQASQIQVLQRNIRALEEQLAEARTVADAGPAGAAAGGESLAGRALPGPAVYGRVQDVRLEDETGTVYVRADLGSVDRMAEGVELSVFRQNEFLGTIRLTSVDLQSSTGRVVLAREGFSIRAGDRVTTRLLP